MECPNCGMINFDSASWCNCGYDFEVRQFIPRQPIWKNLINIFYGFIGFPLKCLKCGKHYSHETKNCSCGFIPTETRLQKLINLSINTATKGTSSDVDDPKGIALKCVEKTEVARAYSTRRIFWNLTSNSRDCLIQHRCDFIAPDRYHVSQVMWDSNRELYYDEWVTLGNQHYQNAGLWTLSGNPEKVNNYREDDSYLLVNYFLTVLRIDKSVSSDSYQYQGSNYLVLKYENTSVDLVGPEQEIKELRIWISLDTYLLAKVELIIQGQTPKGDEILTEMQHAFTAYNEKIEVRPPAKFHSPDAEGKFLIQHTEIENLPHHP